LATVMIVDDSSIIRRNLREILNSMGLHVTAEAEDGAQAIELYKAQPVDLVTMDIQLPGMNGIEAVKHIREFNPHAVIIMISSVEQKSRVYDAIKQGAKHYIVKPFSEEKVREVIRGVLKDSPLPDTGPESREIIPNKPAKSVFPEADQARTESTPKRKEPLKLDIPPSGAVPFEITVKDGRIVIQIQKHINMTNLRYFHACLQGLLYLRSAKFVVELWEPIIDEEGTNMLLDFVIAVRSRKGTIAVVTAEVNHYTVLKSKLGSGVYKSAAEIEW
jgi:CheY-like chemotaxis protein